jgi:polysaccharide deacetylase family protein (PEP-CTERM system associated)
MTIQPINAITVDVEDYFQVSAFSDRISTRDWPDFESRVEANTRRLLKLLEKHAIRGTFFVLGWIAERYPDLVKDIQRDGHEIGCHSYWHRLVYDLTPEEFSDDIVRARDVLQDITGDCVRLFRAPSFSITKNSLWAFDILGEEGFTCDSSIYPTYHDCYGIPDSPHAPYEIVRPTHNIIEFPGTMLKTFGVRLPISGGGYFRLYPGRFTEFCLRKYLQRNAQPFMFYIHPWEIDPDQPRLAGSFRSRFRHYQNLASTFQKLDWLLPRFVFGTMSESLNSITEQQELSVFQIVDDQITELPTNAEDCAAAETTR